MATTPSKTKAGTSTTVTRSRPSRSKSRTTVARSHPAPMSMQRRAALGGLQMVWSRLSGSASGTLLTAAAPAALSVTRRYVQRHPAKAAGWTLITGGLYVLGRAVWRRQGPAITAAIATVLTRHAPAHRAASLAT